ncbi:hypothetical protein ABZV67_38895 [Streptomyces sp. NPDC005065]|uniref:hypothetical protein n=1 Tax=Streptomyces sp. NPDC005065 TaxID=3154461 RepID=UPI0033B1526D
MRSAADAEWAGRSESQQAASKRDKDSSTVAGRQDDRAGSVSGPRAARTSARVRLVGERDPGALDTAALTADDDNSSEAESDDSSNQTESDNTQAAEDNEGESHGKG